MAPKRKSAQVAEDSDSNEIANKPAKKFANGADCATKKLKFDLQWIEHGERSSKGIAPLIYLHSSSETGCPKIASFDIDNTIIATKSGKNFAINASDWKWFSKEVPQKLKELHSSGFRIVFFTNQAGIEKQKVLQQIR
jgi:bifunctional polynucleotide phosphatase/kinase